MGSAMSAVSFARDSKSWARRGPSAAVKIFCKRGDRRSRVSVPNSATSWNVWHLRLLESAAELPNSPARQIVIETSTLANTGEDRGGKRLAARGVIRSIAL